MAVEEPIAGWYGKIPALGDFVSRRLPTAFIDLWDQWLQGSLSASRAALGDRWLEVYLNSPIWRFILWPGFCGDKCWGGILMASVDKIGRYFPLTVTVPLTPMPGTVDRLLAAQDWFSTIEHIALACLYESFTVDEFERRLALTPFSGALPSGVIDELAALNQPFGHGPGAAVVASDPPSDATALGQGRCYEDLLLDRAERTTLWWSVDDPISAFHPYRFSGLPPSDHFRLFLLQSSLYPLPVQNSACTPKA